MKFLPTVINLKKKVEEKLFPQIYFNTNFLIPTTLKIIAIT